MIGVTRLGFSIIPGISNEASWTLTVLFYNIVSPSWSPFPSLAHKETHFLAIPN